MKIVLLLALSFFFVQCIQGQTEPIVYGPPDHLSQNSKPAGQTGIEAANVLQAFSANNEKQSFSGLPAPLSIGYYTRNALQRLIDSGNYYSEKGLNEQALNFYNHALKISTYNAAYLSSLAVVHNNMGISFDALGKYQSAAVAFTDALTFAERYPSSKISKSEILQNLAGIFTKLGQYEKASSYLDNIEAGADWNLQAAVLNNKGAIATMQQRPEAGKRYFEASLLITRQHKIPNPEAELNLAHIYFLQQEPGKAISLLTDLMQQDNLSGDNKIAAALLLGQIFKQRKQYESAKSYLLEALKKSKAFNLAEKQLKLESELAGLYELTGDFEQSLKHQKAFALLKDSVDNKEVALNINLLETAYRTAEKDKALLQQKLQLAEQDNFLKKKNNYILIASALVITLGILLFLLIQQFRQKQTIFNKQIGLYQQQQAIEELKAIIKGEEQERERLARNLHDGIGGMLVAAKLNLGAIKEVYPQHPAKSKIDDVMNLLQNTSSEIRRTAHNLMPEILTRAGLQEAIEIYCDELNANGALDMDIQFQGDFAWLQKSAELLIYRIVQELVQNVVKHAGAGYMALLLRAYEQELSITVEDNGNGFEQDAQHQGFGLYSLKQRVAALRGDLSIMSAPGRNTTIFIVFDQEKLIALS